MTIGNDLKEILDEVGTSVQTVYPSTDIIEKIEIEPSDRATKPAEIVLHHLSAISVGTIIKTLTDNCYYLVINKAPEWFEDNIVRFIGEAFRTNDVATGYRVESVRGGDLRRIDSWGDPRYQNVPVLVDSSPKAKQTDIGNVAMPEKEIWLPSGLGDQTGDRIVLGENGQKYIVRTVNRHESLGIHVLEVDRDNR